MQTIVDRPDTFTTPGGATGTWVPPPPPPPPGVVHGRDGERRTRRRRRLGTAALVVAVIVGAALGWGAAIGVVLGFAVLTPLERRFRRHDWPVRRPGLRTDVVHFLVTGILNSAAVGAAAVLVWVPLHHLEIAPFARWWQSLPLVGQAIGAIVLFEVVGYWYHRWSHEVPLLWRFHSVHHSSDHLDWVAAARLHPVEGFFAGLVVAPAFVVLGIRPVEVAAVSAVTGVWTILLHANVRWRLRWLDGIVGTPEYHHWHHSDDPTAWNTNYSGLLPVLDRLFGTYHQPGDRRPTSYGTDGGMPDGWWAQMREPFRARRRPGPSLDLRPCVGPAVGHPRVSPEVGETPGVPVGSPLIDEPAAVPAAR